MSGTKILFTRELVGSLPELKVELRQHPQWAKSQVVDDPDEKASEMAAEAYSEILRDDLLGYLQDMAGPLYKPLAQGGPREWTPRPLLNEDDIEGMADAILDHESGLDETEGSIRTALEYAFQKAIWADTEDVRRALHDDAVIQVESMVEYLGSLWEPLGGKWMESEIAEDLLSEISYSVDVKKGTIWLTFTPGLSHAVTALLNRTPAREVPRTKRGLKDELEFFFARFVDLFFKALKKEMSDIDISNRLEIRKQWRVYIKDEKFEHVRKEMLEFVRHARRKESGAEMGNSDVHLGIAAKSIYTECRLVNVDSRSPTRLSSVNIVYDQATRRILTISIDVRDGRLRALSLDSCGKSPGLLAGEIELMRYFIAHTPAKYTLTIMDDLGADQAIDAMVSEVLMYNLADPDEIRAALAAQFEACFPVVRR